MGLPDETERAARDELASAEALLRNGQVATLRQIIAESDDATERQLEAMQEVLEILADADHTLT